MRRVVYTLIGILAAAQLPCAASIYTVTNVNDSGPGSLRVAMLSANSTPGPNQIVFTIPGTNAHTIFPLSALPTLTNSITIDGYTQPGASPNTLTNGDNAKLLIELNGSNVVIGTNEVVASGLELDSPEGCRILGLVINSFGHAGISIDGTSNTVEGCFIGTDVTGTSRLPNSLGIEVSFSEFNLIGGTNAGARNIISGNTGDGVLFVFATSTLLQGNFIGTDLTGTRALPNQGHGLHVGTGRGNLVGGTSAGAGNLISGNGLDGINFYSADGVSIANVIQGNLIGTDITGARSLGNSRAGVSMVSSFSNFIGGAETGARNIISGNGQDGILLSNSGANIVSGNLIGVARDGHSPLSNGLNGVLLISPTANNLIGGTVANSGNVIAFNELAGVRIGSSNNPSDLFTVGNATLGNSIFSNSGLGIDLGSLGPTPNDPGDNDAGANDLQNFPNLNSAAIGTNTIIQGTLNSLPNSTFRIEFFANNNPNLSDFGEGEMFLGFTNVTTDSSGNTSFAFVPTAPISVGQWVTTTATGPTNSTSEFSRALQVRAANWIVRYNGLANGHDQVAGVAVDGSGNVYITGLSFNTNNSDYATIKYNAIGQVQWVARYDGGGFDGAKALVLDSAGNVYVTGYSASAGGSPDFATLKYAPDGTQLWFALYNGPGNGYDAAKAIQVDTAGNVYVTGDSWGTAGFDFATVKYDSNGNQLWVARYDGVAHGDDSPAGLAVDAAGNVYVIGWSGASRSGADCATVKYSPGGEQQWAALYHGPASPSDNAASALALDGAGNVYVTGYSYASASSYDYVTLKYEPTGAQLWVRRYNGPGNYDDQAAALVLDSSTNVVVTGYSYGGSSSADYATVKYDSNGNQLWVARYDGPASLYDTATALGVDVAGDVFVTGISSVSATNSDCVTIKYDAGGSVIWRNVYDGFGNPSEDSAGSIAVDGAGVVYVAGWSTGLGSSEDYLTAKYAAADSTQDGSPTIIGLGVPTRPLLTIEAAGTSVILRWADSNFSLQSASTLAGAFATLSGATSPYTNALVSNARFFRLRAN